MNNMETYTITKINDYLYCINETDSVNCYLILGKEKALLFDTGYGYENITKYIKKITNLPLMVVLSHGDPDHGLGSAYFSDIYLHELDLGKLLRNDTFQMRKRALEYRLNKAPQFQKLIDSEKYLNLCFQQTQFHFLKDRDVIDLGNIKLEVVFTPGHSYGHIMLLDKMHKNLFSGDLVTKNNIWYFLSEDEQAPFIIARKSVERLISLKEYIENIYPAHKEYPLKYNMIEELNECLSFELLQNYHDDNKVNLFMGEGYQHFYKNINLIYSKERLEEYVIDYNNGAK